MSEGYSRLAIDPLSTLVAVAIPGGLYSLIRRRLEFKVDRLGPRCRPFTSGFLDFSLLLEVQQTSFCIHVFPWVLAMQSTRLSTLWCFVIAG